MKRFIIAAISSQILSWGVAHAAELPAGVVEAGAITYGVAASIHHSNSSLTENSRGSTST